MSNKRSLTQPDFEAPQGVNLQPLGIADLALVQRALGEIAPDWSVELQGICADEATLVLLPEGGDDVAGPSFMISRDAAGYLVDQVHWDVVTEVGSFTSLKDVIEAIPLRLPLGTAEPAPSSNTLH
jgi:hypothetical protein